MSVERKVVMESQWWPTFQTLKQGLFNPTHRQDCSLNDVVSWWQVVKNRPANAGDVRDVGSIPGSGRPPEGCVAADSSILAWRIPRGEEPGGLQSIGSQGVGHDLKRLSRHTIP